MNQTMKKLSAILIMAALLPATTALASWSGAVSSQLDLPGNWTGNNPPDQNTEQGDITTWANPGYPFSPGVSRLPAVSAGENILLGTARFRSAGTVLTQTGGTLEWLNGTGTTTKGVSFYSRATLFVTSTTYGPGASAANPTRVSLTGGTMITDFLGCP